MERLADYRNLLIKFLRDSFQGRIHESADKVSRHVKEFNVKNFEECLVI